MTFIETVNTISTIIAGLAPVVIAIFTWLNYKMYQEMRKKEEDYKKQTADLFQAIVIATLIGAKGTYGVVIPDFKKMYTGKTKIFEE